MVFIIILKGERSADDTKAGRELLALLSLFVTMALQPCISVDEGPGAEIKPFLGSLQRVPFKDLINLLSCPMGQSSHPAGGAALQIPHQTKLSQKGAELGWAG